jgi:alkanesulfonate monooxygenase SsuD/methylene tetrahydromethanopterin reductase-like flavin-dependent oxidoreductase (luciferase family)
VRVDLLVETFGTTWPEVRECALAAERAGFDGVWLNDHLAGSIQGAPHVLECWTILSALAAEVPRVALGPLVLNVANRDPGVLAVMAATLQEVSGGRLLIGMGAGARSGSTFAIEQEALGHLVPGDAERRYHVEQAVNMLRRVWSGTVPPATGFLRPDPLPPVVIGTQGPKMAELAGRVGDGVCLPVRSAMTELVAVAGMARAAAGRDEEPFLVTVLLSSWSDRSELPTGIDVDRLIVYVTPPFADAISRLGRLVRNWGLKSD